MATPARSFELPRATPSSSAKALLMWSARALAAVSTSVWLEYGTPTPYKVALPKTLARSDGLVPTDAELVPAGAVLDDLLFLRRVPTAHLDLAHLVGRRDDASQTQDVSAHRQGQWVSRCWSGSRPTGPALDEAGCRKWSLPSSTSTS